MSRNTADQWITSNEPTDEPLVGRKLFDAAVAWTGANEKALDGAGDRTTSGSHLSELPCCVLPGRQTHRTQGAVLEVRRPTARRAGRRRGRVDKRISTLAMAIQMGAAVYDLEETELCYTPPFGSAKDPVNFAGMVAAGVVQSNLSWHSSGRFPTTACSELTVMSWRRSWGLDTVGALRIDSGCSDKGVAWVLVREADDLSIVEVIHPSHGGTRRHRIVAWQ